MTQEPSLQPVRVAAVHDLVIHEIRRAVEMWAFPPGGRLPSERDLAEILGVSRNTVRTATAILESEGFLKVRRGRGGGYIVKDPALADHPGEELRRNPEPILNAWDYRLAVDVGAARLAAERRSSDDLEVLAGLLEQLDAAYNSYEQRDSLDAVRHCQALDSKFFLGIAHATHNQFIVDAVVEARGKLWTAFSSYLVKLDPNSQGRRAEIFEAIEKQSSNDAGVLMEGHIKAGRNLFQLWLTEAEHSVPALAG